MSKTTLEEAIAASLPDGFKTTFKDSDKLRKLQGEQVNNLGQTVEDYDNFKLTEQDIIENEAQKILTSYLLPERTLELPGLALSLEQNLLKKFAARYKRDNDTPSGTIKDVSRAGTDDIVFTFATPEVYNEVNDNAGSVSNFQMPGQSAGTTLELIGQGGVDEGVNTNGNSLSLDNDEYLFFSGDFIDLSDGQMVVTKTQWTDVDGEDYSYDDAIFQSRLSGSHVVTTTGTYATATVDLDAKVYEDGDPEVVPVAFYMGPGTKAPSLV